MPLPPFPVRFACPYFLVQSALFNLSDLITVLLLLICICTYIRGYRKGIFDVEDGTHHGLRGEKLTPSPVIFYRTVVVLRQLLLRRNQYALLKTPSRPYTVFSVQ